MSRFDDELQSLHEQMDYEQNPDYQPIPDEFFVPAMTIDEYYEEFPERKPKETLIRIEL